MLVALHACDTATDDAIYSGIRANASVIIVRPFPGYSALCKPLSWTLQAPSLDMMSVEGLHNVQGRGLH